MLKENFGKVLKKIRKIIFEKNWKRIISKKSVKFDCFTEMIVKHGKSELHNKYLLQIIAKIYLMPHSVEYNPNEN